MYNVELFNMFDNSFVDSFVIGETMAFGKDYLAPKPIDLEAPADINIGLKNTVRIMDLDRNMLVYNGYVMDFQQESKKTIVTVAPLQMLLNEVSMQNVFDDINDQNWAYQIYQQIWNDFMRSTPSIYSIPWIYASAYPISNWGNNKKVGYGAELKKDLDCIIQARKSKGLYMRFGLYTTSANLGRPSFGFYKFNSGFTLEADLENVLDRKINETSRAGYNTALIWYPRDDLGNYNSYCACLIDGVMYYDYASYLSVENPRLIEKVLDHQPDQAEREKLFASMLQVGSDNLEIELTYKIDDKLIQGWSEGKPATIITSKKTYNTYCTGYSRKGDLLTLKFGTVRQDLTDILNREGN